MQRHPVEERDDFIGFSDIRSLDEAFDRVRKHRAFGGACRLGQAGFSYPMISTLEVIEVSQETLPRLAEIGINVVGPFGKRNTVICDRNTPKLKLTLHFFGHSFNAVLLDPRCRLRGELHFEGNENLVVAGAACPDREVHVTAIFRYHAAGLLFGAGGSGGHINVWIEGPGRSIQIGDDFLFSWGIWLRTADSHAIIDLESGNLINSSRSIVIGPHVWLGQEVMVMAGAQIGGGTVIGARSIVTKVLPSRCVAVGAPAKIVRRGASWTRKAHPGADEISALQGRIFEDP